MKKLADKRTLIMIILAGILLVLWVLHLILGSGQGKITVLVLTLILPMIIYGFVRLLSKVIGINAPLKVMNVFAWFFLICGTLGIVLNLIVFISGFPNGLSPSLGACMGLVTAVLDEAKKNFDISKEK